VSEAHWVLVVASELVEPDKKEKAGDKHRWVMGYNHGPDNKEDVDAGNPFGDQNTFFF
jgi:hypothetical protein